MEERRLSFFNLSNLGKNLLCSVKQNARKNYEDLTSNAGPKSGELKMRSSFGEIEGLLSDQMHF